MGRGGFHRGFVQCPADDAGLQQSRERANTLKSPDLSWQGTPANQIRYTTMPFSTGAMQLCGLESLG
jgi:hypothetical protein